MVHGVRGCTSRLVLVVEDDSELNQLIGAYVALAGFEWISAANGFDALHQARQREFAAVVLDLMLPDLGGMEVCRRLKADPSLCGIPIIMLTAMHGSDMRQEGLECGAADYLTKPFDPDQFLDVLSRHAAAGQTVQV